MYLHPRLPPCADFPRPIVVSFWNANDVGRHTLITLYIKSMYRCTISVVIDDSTQSSLEISFTNFCIARIQFGSRILQLYMYAYFANVARL